jgi:hypothetical protein
MYEISRRIDKWLWFVQAISKRRNKKRFSLEVQNEERKKNYEHTHY